MSVFRIKRRPTKARERDGRAHRRGVRVVVVLFGVCMAAATSPARAQSSDDYHVEAFGDALDFSNPEDAIVNTTEAMMMGTTNRSISGGQLRFDTSGIFRYDPVWAGYPTGTPHGREGGRVPIDASRYRRLIIRMNAPGGAPMGVRWYSCLEQNASCTGGRAFVAQEGWQTYDLNLGEGTDPSLPVPWSGSLLGVSVVGNVAGHFDIDYVRLVGADVADTSERTQGPPASLFRDDRLDYATAAGDPWDMNGPGDVSVVNLRPGWSVANGRLSGCTLGASSGRFPQVFFSLPGGRTIDANRFTTLTFEYSYEGTFGTRPVAGGGVFARVFWFDERGVRHPTASIHLYPNERVVQVRLNDQRSVFRGNEGSKGETGKPWAGVVTKLLLSPIGDPAPRCFTLGRVTLTADEPAGASLPPQAGPVAKAAPQPTSAAKAVATSAKKKTPKKTAKKSTKKSTKTTK